MGKQKEKVMENDPDNTRIAHDTADAVSIYMQKKIMPTFSGHTSKEIRDLIDDSRQLLQKVHRKLRAAAAAEGNAAKQAQKGKTSALLLWATPPIRGVRRLTTYGGASRWLKFQLLGSAAFIFPRKRPSAAAELQGAASSQQQLFLAWMQSMGRRQDSIFQDAASKPLATEDSDEEDDDDELSDDSEDMGSHRGGTRPAREERPLQSRGLEGSEHGLLGFARQVADEVGPSDEVSASDIMMFAKKVAQANHSESGVITESSGVGFDFRAGARHRAQD
eukprot:g13944.t1